MNVIFQLDNKIVHSLIKVFNVFFKQAKKYLSLHCCAYLLIILNPAHVT